MIPVLESLAMNAVGRAARERAGKMLCSKDPHLATGSKLSFIANIYCKKVARIKLGMERPKTEKIMRALSCHLPWKIAEREPRIRPNTKEIDRAPIPRQKEIGKPSLIISTTCLFWYFRDGPKERVESPFMYCRYCTNRGLSSP